MKEKETEMMNHLIYNINTTLMLGDFKDANEMLNTITVKVETTANDAANWGYEEVNTIAQHIQMRLARLKGIRKGHLIEKRIKDIITNTNY
jgi:hypothetical protein